MTTTLNIRVIVDHSEHITPERLRYEAYQLLGGEGRLTGLNNLGQVEHVKVEAEIARDNEAEPARQ